jgi:hydrogenase maturation protease
MTATRVLVIGCGNLLRGDDAAGPLFIGRLCDRGLPEGVRCVDGGTAGIEVAMLMRGVPEVILVDACRSDSPPGSLFELPGSQLEQLSSGSGVNLHAFRWDHAVALGRRLLGEDYPTRVTAYLVEGERFDVGMGLSAAVDAALDRLADLVHGRLSAGTAAASSPRETSVAAPSGEHRESGR